MLRGVYLMDQGVMPHAVANEIKLNFDSLYLPQRVYFSNINIYDICLEFFKMVPTNIPLNSSLISKMRSFKIFTIVTILGNNF